MAAFPSWLRNCAAMILTVGLVGLGFGCKHGSSNTAGTVGLAGAVTYTRLPVAHDGNGSPTGLGSGVVMPARGVVVRAFQLYIQPDQAGNEVPTWRLAGTTQTDVNGYYSFSTVYAGYATFVEVESVYQQPDGHESSIKLIADPAGINSTKAETDRPIYVYREDVGGRVFTDPTSSPTSVAMLINNATVNVALGASDVWAVTVPTWYLPGSNPQAPTETQALGSKVLGILDSAYQFSYYYGDPTPSRSTGGVLDLHYYPGRTEPRRSFVVYDTSLTPLSFDGTKSHYFGSLAAGPSMDDAWDTGVILPLLARNNLYGQNKTTLFPTGHPDLTVAPDLALVEGLGDAMAANLLGTPFLTDLTAATPFAPRDIRVLPLPGLANVGYPASISGLAWAVTLQANFIASPGTYAQWQAIDPAVLPRFFTLIYPTSYASSTNTTNSVQSDIANIYTQVGRLLETNTIAGEPVHLPDRFSPYTLQALCLPYGVDWNATYNENNGWPYFSLPWGQDPDSVAANLTFNMVHAGQVADPNPALTDSVYPNSSFFRAPGGNATTDVGEVFYATLALTMDQAYTLSITPTAPATLPAGASIEVVIDGAVYSPYVLSNSSPTSTSFTLAGSPTNSNNPTWHYIRIRLLSPATLQSGLIALTLNLTKTS